MQYAPIREEDGAIVILDQTKLPREMAFRRLRTLQDAAEAIRRMEVRGAPLIGATAAFGVALGLAEGKPLAECLRTLAATRPTAVNLHWALTRMENAVSGLAPEAARAAAWAQARAIAEEDRRANAVIARHGLEILLRQARGLGRPLSIMTHCNAGWLATVAHGTALAPIYAAHAKGVQVHVWVSETRPRCQGLLTAWELAQSQVPHTLIADNAAGLLMMQGRVDLVLVGADRIAANGDVANKIGTYLKALAAAAHGVPFYVAAPTSTIDFSCAHGRAIPIEERGAEEFGNMQTPVLNPAFDVTPARLITGFITEQGVFPPDRLAEIPR
ncbi:MAG: S-methyl-5-thioribose-1-phosphate isomerase [Rhodocyclaceae bacterium]|nr:S-methyl-5-thioribose-1-phosphate isomerase [Rhodocyclaceae bacterium]